MYHINNTLQSENITSSIENTYKLNINSNKRESYVYNNTQDLTIDLNENVKITYWNSAVTAGHYYSDLDATNVPYNTIDEGTISISEFSFNKVGYGFCGNVECITDKVVIRTLYSTTNYDMNKFMRKAVYDPNNTIFPDITENTNGWKFGNGLLLVML